MQYMCMYVCMYIYNYIYIHIYLYIERETYVRMCIYIYILCMLFIMINTTCLHVQAVFMICTYQRALMLTPAHASVCHATI